MNNSTYLKFILTIGVIAIIYFGIVGISAIDRIRQDNLKIVNKLENIEGKISTVSINNTSKNVVENIKDNSVANYEFFDHNAEDGGRLIQAIMSDTSNMNSLINNEATASMFDSLCNDTLATRNYKNPAEFQPLLAKSWEISSDHKTYHIKLRKGVLWQDFTDPVTKKKHSNVEVTAKDFKFMLDVILNKDVNCEPMRVYLQDIESFELINDYEFVIKWKKPYYGSKAATLSLSPLPRHFYYDYEGEFDGKKFNNDHLRNRMIVGCGAYKFVSWQKDRRIVLRRNEKYYGKALGISPALEYLVFDIIKHPNTRFQSMLAGEIDRLGLLPDQWVQRANEEIFKTGKVKKHKYLLPQFTYVGYNLKNPLFQDKQVRQALTMLIDREKICKEIYFNLAEIITGPFFPESEYSNPAIKPYPFDVEKAKKLLKEANWVDTNNDGILDKNGKKFEFTMMQIAGSTTQQRMMPMIKEYLAIAGIDMKIQNIEWSVYTQRLQDKNFDACSLGWSSSFDPDMYQIWHSSQADKHGSSNHISFKNAQADKIIEEMRKTFDIQKRIKLAHEFAEIIHEEQPYTFMFAPYSLVAISSRYKNVKVFPVGMPDLIMWVPKAEQLKVPGL